MEKRVSHIQKEIPQILLKFVVSIHFFYKKPVYKQPVLRPLKNVATFEAQKSPVA